MTADENERPGEPPESAPQTAPSDRPWRRALRVGLSLWLVSRVAAGIFSVFAWFSQRPHIGVGDIAYRWGSLWDAGNFLKIADHGYVHTFEGVKGAAFFPLYPALIKAFTPLCLGRSWLAALVVANLSLLALLVLLHRLTEHEFGAETAGRTAFYLLAFPTALFFTAAYNEGLFIALLVGAVYCMRRGHWWAAGLVGAFASSARSAGLLLLLPFCYEYLRQHGRRLRRNALAAGLIPLGLTAFALYTWSVLDDPLAFSHAQDYWKRELQLPWVGIFVAGKRLVGPGHFPTFQIFWAHDLLEVVAVLGALALVVLAAVGPWRMRRDQLVFPLFGFALILFMISFPITTPATSLPLVSSARIGLEVFPAFMMLGRLGRHPAVDRLLLLCFLPLQGLLTAEFLHGAWVA